MGAGGAVGTAETVLPSAAVLGDRNVVRVVAAAIFFVAFGVYVATLAPTVFLIDSSALTVAAWSHGSAHPPRRLSPRSRPQDPRDHGCGVDISARS